MNIKHFAAILLFACLLPFTSCLKPLEEGEVANTVIVGHEEVPNIKTFMPKELFRAFEPNDSTSSINYGDVPAWLEGVYAQDTTFQDTILYISNQMLASAKLRFSHNGNTSDSDSTCAFFKADSTHILDFLRYNDDASYFANIVHAKEINPELLSRVYIIGNDNGIERRFTAYYYEVQSRKDQLEKSVNAVILSGIGPIEQSITSIPFDTVCLPMDSIPTIAPSCYIHDTLQNNDSIYCYIIYKYIFGNAPKHIKITDWKYKIMYYDNNNALIRDDIYTIPIDKLYRKNEQ